MVRPDLSAVSYLTRETGVPSSQVLDLALDGDGRLWLATPSGLACYDGSRITSYARQDGLRSYGLRAVCYGADGRLWAGSDAGYDLLADNRVQAIPDYEATWQFGYVECLACTEEAVWLGTSKGLVGFDGHEFRLQQPDALQTGPVRAVTTGRDGRVWVATAGHGVFYRAHGKWVAHDDSEWTDSGEAVSLAAGPRNDILIGTTAGFVEVSKSGFVRARQDEATRGSVVRCMSMVGDELWAAVGDDLHVYQRIADTWRLDSVVLEGQLFNAILPDAFGNVWAASESHGVARVSVLRKSIRKLNMSSQQAVFAIRAASRERIIVGGENATCYRRPAELQQIEDVAPLNGREVWDILAEPNDALYAATASGLVYVDGGGRLTEIGGDHPVLRQPNRCLQRHERLLYVGTIGGCVAIDADQVVRPVKVAGDDPLGYLYTLERDASGRLWGGTIGNGLWRLEDGRFERFEHELLSRQGNTYAIDCHADGRIVFVQDDRIFLLSADDRLKLLTTTDDPIAGWAIRWGQDGTVWAGSTSGLTQYNVIDGRAMRQVTSLLGISNWEFTTSRSLYIHDAEHFYCGVNAGVVQVNPKALAALPDLPPVSVGSLSWERVEPRLRNDRYEVPFSRWTLSLNVFTGWFVDEADVQYRFRLTGFDEDWRELQSEASVRLNTLPPGDYQLEAQAYNRIVGFGPAAELVRIRVQKPSWVSQLLSPLSGIAEMRRISRAAERNRTLNRENIELQQLVKERTADLELAKQRLEDINRELANQSITDALTGIGNRRHFDEQLTKAVADARRNGKSLSLLLLDVDFFKPYNDIYGHAKGDDCLSFVARRLVSALYRPGDQVARYGGEEFAVLLQDATGEGALGVAERLRISIEELRIEHRGQPDTGIVTVSVGIGTWDPLRTTQSSLPAGIDKRLFAAADGALYEAKETGRNRCVARMVSAGS